MLKYVTFKIVDVILAFNLIFGTNEILRIIILKFDENWQHFTEGYPRYISILFVSVLCVVTGVLSLSKGIVLKKGDKSRKKLIS